MTPLTVSSIPAAAGLAAANAAVPVSVTWLTSILVPFALPISSGETWSPEPGSSVTSPGGA